MRFIPWLLFCCVWLFAGASLRGASPAEISFALDVMPILSKAGCNSGACHGNANGKGGFRLSLRGQDPAFDYTWLTHESRGRRVNRVEPAESLILLKPTGQIAHQGGVRFHVDALEYRVLHDWIAGGLKGPDTGDPSVLELRVRPRSQFVLAPQDSVQLRVEARFSDGSTRDVTRMATYELSNMAATVTVSGQVVRQSYGATTVMVRFVDQQRAVRLVFVPERPEFQWNDPPPQNRIDTLLYRRLRRMRLQPAPLCSDTTFVRRAYLDAIGVLPTGPEARRFVADPRPDKRSRLIDDLLFRPEFAEHWALKWSDILRNEEKVLDPTGVEAFHGWIRNAIAEGLPIDRFVRAMLRAEGSTYENPPANFWRANRSPDVRGETTARLFLGARLQCAKCHNHPFDRWTQDDYYRWAAMFARIDYEVVDNQRLDRLDKNEFNGEQRVLIAARGSVADPRTGEVVPPKLLGGPYLNPGSYHDRLTPLAVWLTSPENRTFARTQANFVWYHLMGRGLVEPIDDFRATNPAVHPELLEALADELIRGGFHLRHLVRTIMHSRAYQLSAVPNPTNAEDHENFSRAIVARLPAEKLLDAQSAVLDVPATFNGYARGTRAGQLTGVQKVRLRDRAPAAGDRFLKAFGKPERLLACECERSNETTLAQAFLLIGGDLHQRLAHPDGRLARLAKSSLSDEEVVDELYWTALSRPPTETERNAATALLAGSQSVWRTSEQLAWARLFGQFGLVETPDDRFARLQDLAWALMNSKEFLLRH